MNPIVPDTRWLDRSVPPGSWRRILEITEVDAPHFVHGVGWWQQKFNGEWVDDDAPGARRKTRIREPLFRRRCAPLEA